jgi:hypothetical protein
MHRIEVLLVVLNVVLCVVFGIPLARAMARSGLRPRSAWAWFGLLFVFYGLECAAFSASMATNVWSFALAFVWGIVFGRMFRRHQLDIGRGHRLGLAIGLYSSLPAVSFSALLVLLPMNGWSLLSVEEAYRFGIPQFVPWPLNTIGGFVLAVSGSALVAKTVITLGAIHLLLRPRV